MTDLSGADRLAEAENAVQLAIGKYVSNIGLAQSLTSEVLAAIEPLCVEVAQLRAARDRVLALDVAFDPEEDDLHQVGFDDGQAWMLKKVRRLLAVPGDQTESGAGT